ncbi:MAG: hypothetical protein ACXWJ6_16405, partial [Xanthobacteraceae bacterium]
MKNRKPGRSSGRTSRPPERGHSRGAPKRGGPPRGREPRRSFTDGPARQSEAQNTRPTAPISSPRKPPREAAPPPPPIAMGVQN